LCDITASDALRLPLTACHPVAPAESSNSSCGSSAPSSRFSPRSAQRRSLELIAEHAAAKTAKAQRHEQQDQEEIKPMRPWRQNSLDSAYDLHRIKAPPAQPRGFMVA